MLQSPADEQPQEVWVFDFGGVDDDQKILGTAFIDHVVAPSDMHDCYVISMRKSTYEWGASGSSWELLIDAAVGLFTAGMYDVLKSVAAKVATKHANPGDLSREDVLLHVKQAIALRHGDVAIDALELVAENNDDAGRQWTFELQTKSLLSTADVEQGDGLRSTRIRRRRR